ncbi:hypothetical protein EHS17_09060 [Rhodobacteraceae bacterium CH30]|nr:hypothetical protein EHS17_09060 [Rhodobacteraceae bacterium CH30]
MSEPRIALVAEGPTDLVLIEAALRAILPQPFVLTLLQPEATRPDLGAGWGGVFKWCQAFRQRGVASLSSDATLGQFDLVIVHLDADVAEKTYADYGEGMLSQATSLAPLPCAQPCPPATPSVEALERVLLSWLGLADIDSKTLFCIPSKASEAWLAAAALSADHALLVGLECNTNLETRLAQLPKGQKIRKSPREYRSLAGALTTRWTQVKARCPQALLFEQRILNTSLIS